VRSSALVSAVPEGGSSALVSAVPEGGYNYTILVCSRDQSQLPS